MFQLQAHDEPIEWPITVNVPVDGGKTQPHVFTGSFLLMDQDELNALVALGDKAVIKSVLKGWGDDVSDANGKALKFNDKNLNAVLKIAYLRNGIIDSYYNMINGVEAKNSVRLPSAGQPK